MQKKFKKRIIKRKGSKHIFGVRNKDGVNPYMHDKILATEENGWVRERINPVYFFPNEMREKIPKLKSTSTKLLLVIMTNLGWLCDKISINIEGLSRDIGMSPRAIHYAIDQLKHTGFIQKTIVPHVYWINPHFFFQGSRIERYPDKVEIKKIEHSINKPQVEVKVYDDEDESFGAAMRSHLKD